MRLIPGNLLAATAMLICGLALLFPHGAASAETADEARAARIRNQMAETPPRSANDADLNGLRSDLTRAMEAVVARIGALEKDMIDIKSRILVLESRKASGGAGEHAPNATAPGPSE